MTVLVTGSSGCANAIVARLEADGLAVRQIAEADVPGGLGPYGKWTQALQDVQTVVHTAELAIEDPWVIPEPDADYDWLNAEGTLWLAEQAGRCGVRRVVLISSAEVLSGAPSGTTGDGPVPEPRGDYARSKWRAERHVVESAFLFDFEPVVLRPTLLIGADLPQPGSTLTDAIKGGARLPGTAAQAMLAPLAMADLAGAVSLAVTSPDAANLQVALAGADTASMAALASRLRPKPPSRRSDLRERLVIDRLASIPLLRPRAFAEAVGWRPTRSLAEALSSIGGDVMAGAQAA